MDQEDKKRLAANAALDYIQDNIILGVGTGSTTKYFIEGLLKFKDKIQGAVPSSIATQTLLKKMGIPILDANFGPIALYVDGADEFTKHKQLIKGGGAALTREKIIAAIADVFVCIVDDSKEVKVLGQFPLPVEVIPMARSFVAREIVKLGGDPEYREGVVTDNGNIILDVHNLDIFEPIKLEQQLNNITGVVANGLFAMRGADVILVGRDEGLSLIR